MKSLANKNYYVLFHAFLGFVLGGNFKKRSEVLLLMYEGERLYMKSKWELAWKKFIMAENLSPNNIRIFFYLANIYFFMDRYDYSLDYVVKFRKSSSSKIKEYYKLEIDLLSANIKAFLGKSIESINLLKEIISDKEEKVESRKVSKTEEDRIKKIMLISYRNLARLLVREKKFDEAKDYFNKAIKIEEKGEILYDLGLIDFMKEDYEKAIKSFSESIRLGYSSDEIFFKRAYSYFKQGDYSNAREDFKRILIDFPEGALNDSAKSFLETIKYF